MKAPVFGICGYSGAGKTTLIEALVPALTRDGLSVAVLKHDAHGLALDREGKDTARFFRAGATVLAHDASQVFIRMPKPQDEESGLGVLIGLLSGDHDIILVEGHKATPLPAKLWLQRDAGDDPPDEAGPVLACLSREQDRLGSTLPMLTEWVAAELQRRPVRAGILIGGVSSRMGSPKHLLSRAGRTWVEHIAEALRPSVNAVCVLGSGDLPQAIAGLPRLPDAPGHSGPAAGMIAAMRWDPLASWVFAACDMPGVTPDAIAWLLEQRRPGCWAVMPRTPDGRAQPLLAWYDPRMRAPLELAPRPIALADHPKAVTPTVPERFASAWWNANSPDDMKP